jgi:hypothetical protein
LYFTMIVVIYWVPDLSQGHLHGVGFQGRG